MKKIAMVFPGQGSQAIGMLAELAEQYDVVEQTFDQASEVLNIDLWQLAQTGPLETLNQTEFTQPALLAAGVAVWRVWQQQDGELPAIMAGHSLGEYTALVCAEAIDFTDAIKLVNKRGQYMQQAVPAGAGAMAAILGLDDAVVVDVCQQAAQDQIVTTANFNSPGQVVIAGDAAAVERATNLAKEKGARRALLLAVSVPSHCQLMQPAAKLLANDLAKIEIYQPKIDVINNVDVAIYHSAEDIRDGLLRQLYCSVRWVEVIEKIISLDINTIVEAGPGRVLFGLNRRIASEAKHFAVIDPASLEAALAMEN